MAQLEDDIASIKTTVEQIYELLYDGVDSVAKPPRPAYFKAAVDRLKATTPGIASPVKFTGTIDASLTSG